jgi:hypothetical protein
MTGHSYKEAMAKASHGDNRHFGHVPQTSGLPIPLVNDKGRLLQYPGISRPQLRIFTRFSTPPFRASVTVGDYTPG